MCSRVSHHLKHVRCDAAQAIEGAEDNDVLWKAVRLPRRQLVGIQHLGVEVFERVCLRVWRHAPKT